MYVYVMDVISNTWLSHVVELKKVPVRITKYQLFLSDHKVGTEGSEVNLLTL